MTYGPAFFDVIRAGIISSTEVVVPLVHDLIQPETVVDVGCGEGWWAREFANRGCRVLGLDGYADPRRADIPFQQVNLADGIPDVGTFDLAVCLEVAEHLPPERAPSLAADLFRLAPTVLFSGAIPGQGGTGHCFPSGTVVSGPSATGSFAREYEGAIVEMTFASGNFLSATPNHPVLTPRGWIAAGELKEGDDVVRCLDGERLTRSIPCNYQIPSLVEDVVTAVGAPFNHFLRCMPVAAEDFHGDGVGSKIAVVRSDRLLRDGGEPTFTQPGRQLSLSITGVGSSLLSCDSPPTQCLETELVALHSADESINNALTGFVTAAPWGDPVHFESPASLDTSRSENPANGSSGDAELFGKFLRRGPGLVEIDQVCSVHTSVHSHTVYNLSTRVGWYIANGIIVHNCNEQWQTYWRDLLVAAGYAVSGALRFEIWNDSRVENWYRQNLLVATETPERYPQLFDTPLAPVWPLVHPVLYNARRGA